LKSKWTGPFIIKKVFAYGAVELENPKNGDVFKVNGQRIKPFLEGFTPELEIVQLDDPDYDQA
jgi:hypothetical protein